MKNNKTNVVSNPHTQKPHPLGLFLQVPRYFIRGQLSRLPPPLAEFILFGLKMAWACLFGATLLTLLILTHLFWPHLSALHRYDFLFISAVLIQILMLVFRLETLDELKVIGLYHLIGTVMEVYKTHMGSWAYPEAAVFRIEGVPLFTGFMYASVGSFIVRAIRIMDMRFIAYPKLLWTYILAIAIYINFFTHHYVFDIRYILFALIGFLFWRTVIVFRVDKKLRHMPFVLAAFLSAFFLWVAENLGTLTQTWVYPGQEGWHLVSLHKMGAWGLLLVISFVTVSLVHKPLPPD
jgi:uncharacterized membrane protein YoaT (DUF817 family)